MTETTCRLCLSTEGSMESLFDDKDPSNSLREKILNCLAIEFQEVPGLPSHVCECCKSKLIISFHFKKQCIDTEKKVREIYSDLFTKQQDNIQISCDESVVEEVQDTLVTKRSQRVTRNSSKSNGEHKSPEVSSITEIDSFVPSEPDSSSEAENQSMSDSDSQYNDESKKDVADSDPDVIIKVRKIPEDKKKTQSDSFKMISGKKVTYHTKCKICGKMQQNIKQHQRIHSGEKPYKCSFCGKSFAQTANYKHHLNIHTGHKPYKCTYESCEKAFGDPNSLKSHMVKHTGERKYRCEICGNGFGYSHTLKSHIRTHIQDKKHACSFCGKLFLTTHGLRKHERTHTGEKPYQCEICSKSFSTSGNLSTHKRVHTKVRPFQCTVCNMRFGYRNVLNCHMKIHSSKSKDIAVSPDSNDHINLNV